MNARHMRPQEGRPQGRRPAVLQVPARIRAAIAADAGEIAGLYLGSYASADGRVPAQNYPYPQVLDPAWLAGALGDGRIEALVAEREGQVCATVAAAPERAASGGLAEFFGLVTEPTSRGRGLATRVLQGLCDRIGGSVHVAVGEVRTADPAATQVVEKTALRPVGFEPFAHFMLAGAECMIPVCAVSEVALRGRSPTAATTPRGRALAQLVLDSFGLGPPRVRDDPADARDAVLGEAELLPLGADEAPPAQETVRPGCVENGCLLTIHQMEVLARSESAFEQCHYGLRWRGGLVARARVIRDHRDHRVRILGVEAPERRFSAPILRLLSETLEREARGDVLVIVAEVSTQDVSMQAALEAAGFRPTAYFPAAVQRESGRFDVVQYSRVSGARLGEGLVRVDWPCARRIAEHVIASLASAQGSPRAQLSSGGIRSTCPG